MTTREDFEAWARTHDMDLTPTPIAVYSGIYSDCNTDYAWLAWQAAKTIATNMALRDYFAARAMAAYLIADQGNTPEPEQTANDAYFMADAMLKARGK